MLVLGIETTCDETSCAVVRSGSEILSNVVASQAELHSLYGGVVPELSCRQHVDQLLPVLRKCLEESAVSLHALDLIAVAHAPGLIGALLLGLNGAKALSMALKKPFVGVNHVEAHLYAALMFSDSPIDYPCLGVVASGGHTALWLTEEVGRYQLLGQTIDDAAGEAFDKVARMMGLPYPGGPHIERLARRGDPRRFPLHAGSVKEAPFSFSFSGIKTAALYSWRSFLASQAITPQAITSQAHSLPTPSLSEGTTTISEEEGRCDLAASFQEAILGDIAEKMRRAVQKYPVRHIAVGGGVSSNQRFREICRERVPNHHWHWPRASLGLDNGAMIAGLGYHVYNRHGPSSFDLQPQTRLPLC